MAGSMGTFKGITVTTIRKENGRREGGQGSNGRDIWLGIKVGLSLDFTQKAMGSPKSALQCLPRS